MHSFELERSYIQAECAREGEADLKRERQRIAEKYKKAHAAAKGSVQVSETYYLVRVLTPPDISPPTTCADIAAINAGDTGGVDVLSKSEPVEYKGMTAYTLLEAFGFNGDVWADDQAGLTPPEE